MEKNRTHSPPDYGPETTYQGIFMPSAPFTQPVSQPRESDVVMEIAHQIPGTIDIEILSSVNKDVVATFPQNFVYSEFENQRYSLEKIIKTMEIQFENIKKQLQWVSDCCDISDCRDSLLCNLFQRWITRACDSDGHRPSIEKRYMLIIDRVPCIDNTYRRYKITGTHLKTMIPNQVEEDACKRCRINWSIVSI